VVESMNTAPLVRLELDWAAGVTLQSDAWPAINSVERWG